MLIVRPECYSRSRVPFKTFDPSSRMLIGGKNRRSLIASMCMVDYRRSLIASMCMRSTIGDHGSPACVFERISADSRLHRMRSSTNTCVYICIISVVKDRQHLEARGLGGSTIAGGHVWEVVRDRRPCIGMRSTIAGDVLRCV